VKGIPIGLTESNLDGLVRLLDGADGELADTLVDKLVRMSRDDLARVQSRAPENVALRETLARADVRRSYVTAEPAWIVAVKRPLPDLEEALLALGAASGLPGVIDVSGRLDALAREVGDRLSGDRAFDMGLIALADVFNAHELRGNEADYGNPRNSYLHCVLDTKFGIPISLCCVAILVGQRLGLPVYGVGAPAHFLGFYGDADLGVGTFFDPFRGFQRMSRSTAKLLIERLVGEFDPRLLNAVDDRQILQRTLNNLQGAWGKESEHARNLSRWARVLS
jgi:regulator of sirC expression with transglutaminase-like and TPR domain